MPSSKSSSQLSVCSSGWRSTAGRGSATGAEFFAAAGGGTFLPAVDTGNTFSDEARDASPRRALLGEAGGSCREEMSRPPCLDGRDGAAAHVRGARDEKKAPVTHT
jgi:hypothetical protein